MNIDSSLICSKDREYILSYLSNEKNKNDKQFQTIESIMKYKEKESVLSQHIDLKIRLSSVRNEIVVDIFLLNCSENIKIPKDWFNINIVLNNKMKCNNRITIYSMDNISEVDKCDGDKILQLLASENLTIVDKESLLRYITNCVGDILNKGEEEFKKHIKIFKFASRHEYLTNTSLIIMEQELLNFRYSNEYGDLFKEFSDLEYLIYNCYKANTIYFEERLDIETETLIINDATKRIYKLYIKIYKILQEALKCKSIVTKTSN